MSNPFDEACEIARQALRDSPDEFPTDVRADFVVARLDQTFTFVRRTPRRHRVAKIRPLSSLEVVRRHGG